MGAIFMKFGVCPPKALADSIFDMLDKDRDGRLNKEEFNLFVSKLQQKNNGGSASFITGASFAAE